MSSGCATTQETPRLFTMEEMVSAKRKAVADAWSARSRAEAAKYADERAQVQERISEAVQQGRAQGDAAAVKRIAAEQLAAEKAAAAEQLAAEKAAAARDAAVLAAFTETLAETPVVGARKLRTDKGRRLDANELVDMIQAQLEKLGYKLVIWVSYSEMKTVSLYDQQKLLLKMPPEFNDSFFENIKKMSVLDSLNLLSKLYGFTAWISTRGKVVCLGFPALPLSPHPSTELDLYFNVKEFLGRSR